MGVILLAQPRVSAATTRVDDDDSVRAVPLAAGEHLRLTGRLDHPAWRRAPVYRHFVEHVPAHGAVPPQATQVQVLFDTQALYVGVTVFDTAPQLIRRPLVRDDQVNRTQDFVVVYLDPIGSRRSAQFFRVNAAGSRGDGIHTAADDSEDFSPDFDWDVAAAPSASGWTAVFRLPFASLRFAADEPERWRIMVARRLPRESFHLLTSVQLPLEAPSFIDRLQPLRGVQLPARSAFLSLRPSVTARHARDRSDLGSSPDAGTRQTSADASLDIKWRPRAELVIDGTLNPDFSQVALDVPQLTGNTRFALSIAEKRPFFFESADLLRTPTDAFYTRSFTEPRWGLRATWRGSRVAGSAFAIDDRGGGQVLLPGPYDTGAVAQPASRTVAARARSDEGALQWGAVVAARRYGQDRGDNTVLGPDLLWTIDEAWRLKAQWLQSRSTAQPAADDALVQGDATDGHRLYLRLARNGPMAETAVTVEDIDRNFRHDSGFVSQAGVRKLTLFQSRGWRPSTGFHEFWLNLNAVRTQEQHGGRTIEQDLYAGWWSAGAHNLEWWLDLHPVAQLRPSASGPLLLQRYLSTGLVVTPARWFSLLESTLTVGRLADTQDERLRPGLRWTTTAKLRPLPRLEVEATGSGSWLRGGGRRVYDERLLSLLAVWHLGPRSHLRAIVQRTGVDRGDGLSAAAVQRQNEQSLTWSWRLSAGTVVYAGLSRSRDGVQHIGRRQEAFVKLQADWDEALAWWRGSP
jgi:hypothetical protein